MEHLVKDEFNDKLEYMRNNWTLAPTQTRRLDFENNCYYYREKANGWRYIYYRTDNKYHTYCSHKYREDWNTKAINGEEINEGSRSKVIWGNFFKFYNGCTELKAFGYCDREIIHRCVPKAVHYCNHVFDLLELDHISKVDYSSNYPSHLKGKLPDWHDHIMLKGTWTPTEKYPFAYYIKSGHVAEYGRFDSHEWAKSNFGKAYMFKITKDFSEFDPRVLPEDDVTILCKASQYTFDKIIDKIYLDKCNKVVYDGDITAKIVLNSYIGCMHRSKKTDEPWNQSLRLDHVAAIVLGRASQKMLENYNYLRLKGIPVLQIVVDGIIYQSKQQIGVPKEEEKLGSLVQEITDAKFIMNGENKYMFFKDGICIDEKHSGMNDNLLTTKLSDITKWRRVKKYEEN